MENRFHKPDGFCFAFSVLLELAALNDLAGFKRAIEEEGHDVDEPGLWYGRRIGSKKMGLEKRTPLMIAALFGSKDVLSYILGMGCVDINRASGSDGAMALHCAAAGGSASSPEAVKLLLDASADPNCDNAYGKKPCDLIAPVLNSSFSSRRKALEILLNVGSVTEESFVLPDEIVDGVEGREQQEVSTPKAYRDGSEKKEYPIDLTLPDIRNGIYGTDEFRMYSFKVKPCSRAYSHDWTECPFVHPGENARRRDPRKYHYSCVPCPEFRKGLCSKGDACEYAHGIFECWLHPAQYRTRLCKDETHCTRRVCFFAHNTEELRPVYASTGSAVPSPRAYSANGSTPPMTPTGSSSPVGGWQNQTSFVPPTLQLPGSRLKSALTARDVDLDMELLDSHHRRQQQLMGEISGHSSPSSWNSALSTPSALTAPSGDLAGEFNSLGGLKPTNLEDIFGSLDHSILPKLQGFSLDAAAPQLQSPKGIQMRQSINQQLQSSYPTSLSSSPVRTSPSLGIDSSSAGAAAVFSSRSAAFAKGSQSFIERSAANRHTGFSSPASSATLISSYLSDWGSPDGKLDWAIQGEELNKLRKSASFGFRSNGSSMVTDASSMPANFDEPDVSWVQSLVKDTSPVKPEQLDIQEKQHQQCSEMFPAWVEQLYLEQEQMVA